MASRRLVFPRISKRLACEGRWSSGDSSPCSASSKLPSSRTFFAALVLGFVAFSGITGCQNYGDLLERGQHYYEDNQYEHALSVWRHLETDQDSLDAQERVRYCYLRGMTDYRLGYRDDARYWLGLSRAAERHAQGSLEEDEQERLAEALKDLNAEVFGIAAVAPEDEGQSEEQEPATTCEWSSECESGFVCQDGTCVQAE